MEAASEYRGYGRTGHKQRPMVTKRSHTPKTKKTLITELCIGRLFPPAAINLLTNSN